MDSILNKLTEIESAAVSIVQHAEAESPFSMRNMTRNAGNSTWSLRQRPKSRFRRYRMICKKDFSDPFISKR